MLFVTLLLNLAVSAGKVLVGHLSGSMAMVADGYHSLVDGSNNIIGLVVTGFAYRPPDDGHPYGHRKFETAATLVIGVALLALAYEVLLGAFRRVGDQAPPQIGALNWAVMIATLGVNLFVTWYESREGRRLGSDYLLADAAHTRSDLYVSLGVLASFAGSKAGLVWTDALVAAVIAAIIGVQAMTILVRSFHVLTDRAVLPAAVLGTLAASVPGVMSCASVRTRGRADAVYVDLIVHVDGDLSLRAAHDLADQVEAALKLAHPEIADVVVHLEPAPTD